MFLDNKQPNPMSKVGLGVVDSNPASCCCKKLVCLFVTNFNQRTLCASEILEFSGKRVDSVNMGRGQRQTGRPFPGIIPFYSVGQGSTLGMGQKWSKHIVLGWKGDKMSIILWGWKEDNPWLPPFSGKGDGTFNGFVLSKVTLHIQN